METTKISDSDGNVPTYGATGPQSPTLSPIKEIVNEVIYSSTLPSFSCMLKNFRKSRHWKSIFCPSSTCQIHCDCFVSRICFAGWLMCAIPYILRILWEKLSSVATHKLCLEAGNENCTKRVFVSDAGGCRCTPFLVPATHWLSKN